MGTFLENYKLTTTKKKKLKIWLITSVCLFVSALFCMYIEREREKEKGRKKSAKIPMTN